MARGNFWLKLNLDLKYKIGHVIFGWMFEFHIRWYKVDFESQATKPNKHNREYTLKASCKFWDKDSRIKWHIFAQKLPAIKAVIIIRSGF